MDKNDISILVVSCDTYTEVGNIFFELQEKFMGWFNGRKYFVNETKEFQYPNVETINVGDKCEWSEKVYKALEVVNSEYVLFMLEDYFIGKEVDENIFSTAVELIKSRNLKYYRITTSPKIKGTSTIAGYLTDIPYNVRYGINLQAAIFKKDYLKEIVAGPGKNAWQVENDLNKNVVEGDSTPIPGCVADNRNIIDIHNGVIKGKWVPKTITYFKKIGYKIDLKDRPMMKKKDLTRMYIVGYMSHVFSAKTTRRIKSIMRKLGFKFVTD